MPAIPTIDELPDPPIRGTDSGATFSAKVAAFLIALVAFVLQLNAFAPALVLAAAAANYSAAATDSRVIGTGSKSFTIQDGKMFVAGQYVIAASAADPTTHWMHGTVTSYDSTSGALVMTVAAVGSGVGATRADWNIGLSGPVGAASGTSLVNPVLTGTVLEDVYDIVDSGAVTITAADGSIQRWTLGANRTPAITIADGQSITLMVADGSAYAVTWTTINPTWVGGSAPTLPTTGYAVIEFWKVAGTIYAARVGNVA